MQLGEFISKLRKMRGWSQEVLAEKVGMSRFAIMAWEKDRVKLSDAKKAALASALNIDPAVFDNVQNLEPEDVENMYKDLDEEETQGDTLLPSKDILGGEQRETDFNAIVSTLDQVIDQLKGTKKIRELIFAKKLFEGALDEIEKNISDLQIEEKANVKLLSHEDNGSESLQDKD